MERKLPRNVLLSVIFATLGSSFRWGYNMSIVNPTYEVLLDLQNKSLARYGLNNETAMTWIWSTVCGIYFLAAAIAALTFNAIGENVGRRTGLVISQFIFIVGSLMQAFAYFNLYELFIAGQIVTGLALGLSTSLITPYINEISHESYAPFLHVLVAVTIEIGTTTANFVGIDDILGEKRRWPIVFVFPVIFNIVCIIFFIVWGPETPIRLLKCSKRVEALQSFRFYHQLDDMAAAQLLAESEKQMATAVSTRPMTMKQALVDRANRKALFLACLTGATTNFSGILCITIFGTNIIAQYSEDSAPYINAGVFATSLFGLLIALFCVKDFSHRLLLLIGLPILLVIDIGFAVVQVMELKGNYAMIIFVSLMIAFCAVFSNTLEKIMVFNGVRITRYEYLDATVSIAVAVTFLTTFLAPLAFYPLQQSYPKFSFVPFIIFLIIAWISYFIWYPNDSRVQPSDLQASQSNFKSSGNEKPLTQTGGTKEKV